MLPTEPKKALIYGQLAPNLPSQLTSAAFSQLAFFPGDDRDYRELFPPGKYDADKQQVDLRPENSWVWQCSLN